MAPEILLLILTHLQLPGVAVVALDLLPTLTIQAVILRCLPLLI